MRIISGSDMKNLDTWAVKERGLPTLILMENAGRAAAQKGIELLVGTKDPSVVVLVGKGNNGGDGLAAARHLYQAGIDVKLFLLNHPDNFQASALKNWELIEGLNIKWHLLDDENSFYLLKLSLNQCHLIIDCIFGTGFKGNPSENVARVINIANESTCRILSVDIPSGLDADTGHVGSPCIMAHNTITFAWIKRGAVLYPGRKYTGELEVKDISLPYEVLEILNREEYYVTEPLAKKCLPVLDWEGHKNTFGHLMIIAGSPGMTGAAWLSAKAGLRSGAGLVSACLPSSLADGFDLSLPEVITKGVQETPERTISSQAWTEIKLQLKNKQAIVFGPGIGVNDDVRELLKKILEAGTPLVIDADGLNVLAFDPGILQNPPGPVIITPHPGEMARLLGISTAEVQGNRVETALKAAAGFNAIVVLKGAATVTALPTGRVYINSTGNPVLAAAGTGDVLAGTIGGLMAQGLDAEKAAVLGVYLHGAAGDRVAQEKGRRGAIASDILEAIPLARKALERIE